MVRSPTDTEAGREALRDKRTPQFSRGSTSPHEIVGPIRVLGLIPGLTGMVFCMYSVASKMAES
jgi:hypothetical protein